MCRQLFAFAGKCAEERCVRPATLIVYMPGRGWVRSCETHRKRFPVDAITQIIGHDVDYRMAGELTSTRKVPARKSSRLRAA